jgi:hypothetical protein
MQLVQKLAELERLAKSEFGGEHHELMMLKSMIHLYDFGQMAVRAIWPECFANPLYRHIFICLRDLIGELGKHPTLDLLIEAVGQQVIHDEVDWEGVTTMIRQPVDPHEHKWLMKNYEVLIKQLAMRNSVCGLSNIDKALKGDLTTEEIRSQCDFIDQIGLPAKEDFGLVDLAALEWNPGDEQWLCIDILSADQPMVIGGKKKTMKTAILEDLVISLATGTRFLSKFHVPEPVNVLFVSAENGQKDIVRRRDAILASRGLASLPTDKLFMSFERPRLSDAGHRARLSKLLDKHRCKVLAVDPMYLTLLVGNKRASAANLFDMGEVLAPIADECQSRGVTVILASHFRKEVTGNNDLDDLTFTGLAEFARQSILVGRTAIFTTPRDNRLLLTTHGFARGQHYRLHIDEGEARDGWVVRCEGETETEAALRATSKGGKGEGGPEGILAALEALVTEGKLATWRSIREFAGVRAARVPLLLKQLVEEGKVEQYSVVAGGKHTVAYRLVVPELGTTGTT